MFFVINVINCVFTSTQHNRCLHKQRMLNAFMCSLLANAYKENIYFLFSKLIHCFIFCQIKLILSILFKFSVILLLYYIKHNNQLSEKHILIKITTNIETHNYIHADAWRYMEVHADTCIYMQIHAGILK